MFTTTKQACETDTRARYMRLSCACGYYYRGDSRVIVAQLISLFFADFIFIYGKKFAIMRS